MEAQIFVGEHIERGAVLGVLGVAVPDVVCLANVHAIRTDAGPLPRHDSIVAKVLQELSSALVQSQRPDVFLANLLHDIEH